MTKGYRPVDLDASWQEALREEFEQPYMQQLREFLQAERVAGKQVYPPDSMTFNALNSTPLNAVKVVIIGQDPYHGAGQAHGLAFSVQPGVKIPPSLRNMYKELQRDFAYPLPSHGYLQSWAEQGVLLLNAVLTVTEGQAGAHANQGWERFTSRIIDILNAQCEHLVFLLWGGYAQKKGQHIDPERHLVLTSVHPSPLSAYRGFIGCGHFSAANAYLREHGRAAIDWQVPETAPQAVKPTA